MQVLLALTARLDVGAAIGLSLAVNVLLFAMMIGLGGLIARIWRARPVVSPPPALSRFEIVLATATVIVNAGVMVAGWFRLEQRPNEVSQRIHAASLASEGDGLQDRSHKYQRRERSYAKSRA